MPTTVWLTILRGVYRHDIGGVFSNRRDAINHAKDMFVHSDHYHDIEVVALNLDEHLWPHDRLGTPKGEPWSLEDRNRILENENEGHDKW